MKEYTLFLDFDGFLYNSIPQIEKYLAEINYVASKKYVEEATLQYRKNENYILERYYNNDYELYNRLHQEQDRIYNTRLKINRITRDEILEEVYPVYKDKIPYDKIYNGEHFYDNVVNFVNFLSKINCFKEIYITTHFNSLTEVKYKKKIIEEKLPGVKVIFIPFHNTPYIYDKDKYFDNISRKRTNKPFISCSIAKVDPEKAIFGDDTVGICDEAQAIGSKAFLRDKENDEPIEVLRRIYDFVMGRTDEEEYNESIKDEKVLRMINF